MKKMLRTLFWICLSSHTNLCISYLLHILQEVGAELKSVRLRPAYLRSSAAALSTVSS